MDVSYILDQLNDAQRDAVTADSPGTLVLAGAGSGKTRVLVHRIAWKIKVAGLSPYSIMAVTFTNKAAREMRGRIEELLGSSLKGGMWVGTFHGLAHRLLKAHAREAGLPENFQILDSDDQLRLMKRIHRELQLDDSRWPPRQSCYFINGHKDEGRRSAHIDDAGGDRGIGDLVHAAPDQADAAAGDPGRFDDTGNPRNIRGKCGDRDAPGQRTDQLDQIVSDHAL